MSALLLASRAVRQASAAPWLPSQASARLITTDTGTVHSQHQSHPHKSAEAAAQKSADAPPSEGLHVTVEPLADSYEGVSVITLTRPNARNAIGRRLLRELAECVNLLRQVCDMDRAYYLRAQHEGAQTLCSALA